MKKIKPSFIPVLLWVILCTILLTLPGSSLPKEGWLDKIWADKWIHIGLFAVMVLLWCWAILRKFPKEKLRTVFIRISILCLAYGIGMEFVQKYFIPNRSFDGLDILSDGAGCVVGLIYSIIRYIKK